MDQNLQTIALGIIANGLTSLISFINNNLNELTKENKANTSLKDIITESINSVSEEIHWDGPVRIEEVCLFILSPEVEELIRQMMSSCLCNNDKQKSLKSLKNEFLKLFSLFADIKEDELEPHSESLFMFLLKACEIGCNTAIDNGILAAHEANSTYRFRVLYDLLENMQKNVGFLTKEKTLDLKKIIEYEIQYRQQINYKHSFIIPPHLDTARRIPIDNLYVYPRFITMPKNNKTKSENISAASLIKSLHKSVILGNPGGGKSTFSLKLCYDLSSASPEKAIYGRKVTPILVVLRDYGAEKKLHKYSILQFIETTSNSKYQLLPPHGAIEYMLLNGRAIVIFDGLDELLDTSYRQEISNDIELFCNLYPSVPVLITSREVGYEQAPLNDSKFETFKLAGFDEEQVTEYVKKWFSTDYDLTTDQQVIKAIDLIEESKIVPDLRSNPLMLALMCNIYKGENYIPKNRPDVFEKCATMLFERWDKSRGIMVPIPFEAHIRPAMMYLAHWIYEDEKHQGGVSEHKLIEKATEYLCPRRYEDQDEAKDAANSFIDFCKGRAWVFTDTGTTKDGERLFQFTHRTFLEYFAAAYLVRTNPTPDKLLLVLLPRIEKREWDIVAQLSFQIQNKNIEGACDDLLLMLMNYVENINNDVPLFWNVLSFSARSLSFLVPSPKITRELTMLSIRRCLEFVQENQDNSEQTQKVIELIHDLLHVSSENRGIVRDSIEKFIINVVHDGSDDEASIALQIGLNLYYILLSPGERRVVDEEIYSYWNFVSNEIFDLCWEKIQYLVQTNLWLMIRAIRRDKATIEELFNWYGIKALFCMYRIKILSGMWISLGASLENSILNISLNKKEYANKSIMRQLCEIEKGLTSRETPWIHLMENDNEIDIHRYNIFFERNITDDNTSLDLSIYGSNFLFGALLLFAINFEYLLLKSKEIEVRENIEKNKNYFSIVFSELFYARLNKSKISDLSMYSSNFGFDSNQIDLLIKWGNRDVNFISTLH